MKNIKIRPYRPEDISEIISLFRDAVHGINIRHYTPEQVAIWAPEKIDVDKWQEKLSNLITFVAEIDSKIVGFADISKAGYLDHLYVHKGYQAKGIAYLLFKNSTQFRP